jgi:hypothetical protein
VLRDPLGYRTDKQGEKMAAIEVQDKTNSDTSYKVEGSGIKGRKWKAEGITERGSTNPDLPHPLESLLKKDWNSRLCVLGCVALKRWRCIFGRYSFC